MLTGDLQLSRTWVWYPALLSDGEIYSLSLFVEVPSQKQDINMLVHVALYLQFNLLEIFLHVIIIYVRKPWWYMGERLRVLSSWSKYPTDEVCRGTTKCVLWSTWKVCWTGEHCSDGRVTSQTVILLTTWRALPVRQWDVLELSYPHSESYNMHPNKCL